MTVEKLLELATKKALRTEENDYPYRVTRSEYTTIDDHYYIIKPITIDNHTFNVYVHRELKRGFFEYFHYDSDNCFDNGKKIRYDLYLITNDVLDSKPFFTTTKAERRKIKIENIKNKLKSKELEIS